ncbi:MAG: MarR family winged helix-turn-helix transcriptional regulator [Pseudomonadota bacterium]|nr:MarR family winged helix-turn-helix transcriptional regulator [Pseudomonadota bacterium]
MNDHDDDAPPALDLPEFLPYQLSVAANRVSRALARVYAERFDLTVPEWRVMATLGRFPGLSSVEVAERTAMDKVRVSRAVARLQANGRLTRTDDRGDRRRSRLSLSPAGLKVYTDIVPLARAHEARLEELLGQDLSVALRRALAVVSDLAADSGTGLPGADEVQTAQHHVDAVIAVDQRQADNADGTE